MNIGKLDKRIKIQAPGPVQDDIGEMVPGWTQFATVWASMVDISGSEYIAAGGTQDVAVTKIGIRYLAGVSPSMRILHGSDIYLIDAVLGQDKRSLLLACKRFNP